MTSSTALLPIAQHAAMVMEVIPLAMDSIRQAMRRGTGEQLSVPQFRSLNFIARTPGCSVGDVAHFLGVTMPTASAMADRLARAGLVLPQTAADDRRRSQLQPTASGLAQLAQIQQNALGDLESALSRCSAKELRTLHAGLAVLRRTFRPDIERT